MRENKKVILRTEKAMLRAMCGAKLIQNRNDQN